MRQLLVAAVAAFVLAGCAGTTEVFDTNRAVDANPNCVSRPDRPGEPVAKECERSTGGAWRSKPSEPVDLTPKRDD